MKATLFRAFTLSLASAALAVATACGGKDAGAKADSGAAAGGTLKVALLTPGLGPLVWSDLDRGVGWANFFVIAASISLAQALAESGAASWLEQPCAARRTTNANSSEPADQAIFLTSPL